MESGYTYPERSDNKLMEVCENAKVVTNVGTKNSNGYYQKSAEAIVSRKRASLQ